MMILTNRQKYLLIKKIYKYINHNIYINIYLDKLFKKKKIK